MAKKRIGFFHILLAICLLVVGFFGYKQYEKGQNRKSVETSLVRLNDAFIDWLDVARVASSAPRVALAGPVGKLGEIKKSTSQIEAPFCAERVKAALVASMADQIDGFLYFMRQEEAMLLEKAAKARAGFDAFSKMRDDCKKEWL
jgi:hypothetical protein